MNSLAGHYRFKIFSKNEVESNFFDDVDLVAFPGGIGDSDGYDVSVSANEEMIKNYISKGGRYLGICMGAYWAGSHYLDILQGVDAVQYITRPNTDTRRPHAKDLNVTWLGNPDKMFFYDGCALIGDGEYKTIATYANGDAMAIIQNRIGLIGCHPEAEQFWYDGYSWLRGKYKDKSQILLDFVNQLMKE
jgi:hypothetical protein